MKKLFRYLVGGIPSSGSEESISRDLFVAPVSGSRGLHLQDIDTVIEYETVSYKYELTVARCGCNKFLI